jgi:hypothetical protein
MRGKAGITASIGGLAAAGIVGAHEIAFRIATPDPHERLEQLQETGHAYWSLIVGVSVAFFVAAVVLHLLRTWDSGDRGGFTWGSLAFRLTLAQVSSFFVLESLERTFSSHNFSVPIIEPVFLIGLVLQAAVAVVGALLLIMLSRAVVAIARTLRKRRPVRREVSHPYFSSLQVLVRSRIGCGGRTLRGPPEMAPV